MEVNFSFLCDYADQGAKMTAVEVGIDTLYAQKVPVRHPLLFAVISINFSITEVGQKKLGIRIIDQDGKDIIPAVDGTINVERPAEGYLYRTVRMALGAQMISFEKYGSYSVRWLVDNNEVASAPLRVTTPPPRPISA